MVNPAEGTASEVVTWAGPAVHPARKTRIKIREIIVKLIFFIFAPLYFILYFIMLITSYQVFCQEIIETISK